MKGQGKRFIRGLARGKEGDCTWGGLGRPGAPGVVQLQLGVHCVKSSLCPEIKMPKAPLKTPASYEAALEELEQLVGLIESGQLPLEQLLTGYQRGAELLKFCRDRLEAVENQVKLLDEGVLKPWTQE
jgi:exodeoxyribonuclease VII small subunit